MLEFEERSLAFEVPGRLIEIGWDEGDILNAGSEVARLDDRLERRSRAISLAQHAGVAARLALLEAGARPEDVHGLKASVRAAAAQEVLAARTLAREDALAGSGAGRMADLDAARASHAAATARKQELDQQLARARHGARPEEIEVALADVAAAEAAVAAIDERIERYVLRAELGGEVLAVHAEPEEFLAVGAPVLTLADTDHPFVDVFVPQQSIDRVRQKMPASIRVDAYPRAFAGVVEAIGRKAEFAPKFLFSERERTNIVIRVRVRVEDPVHALWAGVPAFVTFGEPA